MEKYNWTEFEPSLGSNQELPIVRRYVLVMLPAQPEQGLPPAVAVGYLKFAAGDKNCPNFIAPAIGGIPTHWCDCLGDDFAAPLWRGRQEKSAESKNFSEDFSI